LGRWQEWLLKCKATLFKLIVFCYFFGFGGLFPLFPPEEFPVLLGHCGFGFWAGFGLLILFNLLLFTYSICFSATAF